MFHVCTTNLIRFEIFSGWFVEPHLRAVSMKIERFRCCWGSKCFPFVSHSLLLLRTHHDSISMFIIPVDFAVPCAIVVERARFLFFWRPRIHTNAKLLWQQIFGNECCRCLGRFKRHDCLFDSRSLTPWESSFINRLFVALIADDKRLIELYCLLSGGCIRNPCPSVKLSPLPVLVAAKLKPIA